ncbi:MAG: hypothetical protein K2Q01_03105 [Rickettsiales bacterium]|nr:hypothetical protein [Rickettsiales bacterium]
MLTQLHTPIPLKTPKGKVWAVAIIDYGPQWDLQWVTFVHETGECWTFRNSEIRQEQNYTWGLPEPTPISRQGTAKAPEALNGPKDDGFLPMPNGGYAGKRQ